MGLVLKLKKHEHLLIHIDKDNFIKILIDKKTGCIKIDASKKYYITREYNCIYQREENK